MCYTDSISRSPLKTSSSFCLSHVDHLCTKVQVLTAAWQYVLGMISAWSFRDSYAYVTARAYFLLGFHPTPVVIHPKCRGLVKVPHASLPFPACLSHFLLLLLHSVAAWTLYVCERPLSTEHQPGVITQLPVPLSQPFGSPSVFQPSHSPQMNSFSLHVTREAGF